MQAAFMQAAFMQAAFMQAAFMQAAFMQAAFMQAPIMELMCAGALALVSASVLAPLPSVEPSTTAPNADITPIRLAISRDRSRGLCAVLTLVGKVG